MYKQHCFYGGQFVKHSEFKLLLTNSVADALSQTDTQSVFGEFNNINSTVHFLREIAMLFQRAGNSNS